MTDSVSPGKPIRISIRPVECDCANTADVSARTRCSSPLVIDPATVQTLIDQCVESGWLGEIDFDWIGPHPLSAGDDFFTQVRSMQRHVLGRGLRFANRAGLDLLSLDHDAVSTLTRHRFAARLRTWGPPDLWEYPPDSRRYRQAIRCLDELRDAHVQTEAALPIGPINAAEPLRTYRYLRDDLGFTAFDLVLGAEGQGEPATPEPELVGRFLCEVFDEWFIHDTQSVSVRQFQEAIGAWSGASNGVCERGAVCGRSPLVGFDGTVRCCQRSAHSEQAVGNLADTSLAEILGSDAMRRFGAEKTTGLPGYCARCPYLFACNGGCPKDRIDTSPDGEPGLNRYCRGLYAWFDHMASVLERMIKLD